MKLARSTWSPEQLAPLGMLRFSNGRSGSGFCWHSPHSLMAFDRCRPGPPGCFRHVCLLRPKPREDDHHGLIVSFRALAGALELPLGSSSSHGIRVSPSRRYTSRRPLPGAEAPFGPALPHAGSRSTLVVSRHLDGFLRTGVTGLLHPATDQGFAAFHACRRPEPSEDDSTRRGQSPRRGSHPSKTFPRQQPHRITAAVAFLPLPSCPAPHPAETGCLADHPSPKREAYTRVPTPIAIPPRPEGAVDRDL
jgi:hypothetical protein